MKLTPVKIEERAGLNFRSGDTVKVWSKVIEKGKIRLQAFEGLVLARKHGAKETNATFTLRKVASGVGVERIFPLYSPNIDKIEVMKKAKTRRSKLYYIREKAAKEIRKKMKSITVIAGSESEAIQEEETPTENAGSEKAVLS